METHRDRKRERKLSEKRLKRSRRAEALSQRVRGAVSLGDGDVEVEEEVTVSADDRR